jgi:hypothetical protein
MNLQQLVSAIDLHGLTSFLQMVEGELIVSKIGGLFYS